MSDLGLQRGDAGREPNLRLRQFNTYWENTPAGPSPYSHFGRGGLETFAERGTGPVRATFLSQGSRVTVSGGSVYFGAVLVGVVPDDVATRHAVSEDECVVVSGGTAWYITSTAVVAIALPDGLGVRDVVFSSGRFLYFVDDQSGRYYYSAIGDAQTITGLNFASAESNPDPITGAMVIGDNIFIAGTLTGEWHYPTGDPDAPFQRSKGRLYDKGSPAIRSLVLADNSGYFLGSDRVIYRTEAVPTRASTFDIEAILLSLSDSDLTGVSSWTYTYSGHAFVVFNFPGKGTWAYDISYKSWAEWGTWEADRFRVECSDGILMGDVSSGRLFNFSANAYTDVGDPLERVISLFYGMPGGRETNFNLALYTTQGVGLEGDEYGSDPAVEMRFTDNGQDWGTWREAKIGASGDRSKGSLAQWVSLGSVISPGRAFEFRCTDPVWFSAHKVTYNTVRP